MPEFPTPFFGSILLLPYSGKFLEGKIFGNSPFINISEINFQKPCKISDFSKTADKRMKTVTAVSLDVSSKFT